MLSPIGYICDRFSRLASSWSTAIECEDPSNAIAHLSSSPAPGREDLERLDFDEPNKDSHIAMQP